ncbi:hypothetical protein ACF0H5_006332 [Mactra antiquata]
MAAEYVDISRDFKERGQTKNVPTLSSSRTSGIALDDFSENDSTSIERDEQKYTESSDRGTQEHITDIDDTDADNNLAFDSFVETKRPKLKSHHIEEKCLKLCRIFIYVLTFVVIVVSGVICKLNILKIISDYSQLMIIDSVHTVGILSLVFIVLPSLSPASSLNILGLLSIMPSILSFFRATCCANGKFQRRVATGVYHFVILSIQIGCSIWLYLSDTLGKPSSATSFWMTPLTVVFISLAWWENFIDVKLPNSLRTFKTSSTLKDDLNKSRDKVIVYTSLGRLLTVGVCVLLVTYNLVPISINGLNDRNSEIQKITTPTNTSIACNRTFTVNQTTALNHPSNPCSTGSKVNSDQEFYDDNEHELSNRSKTPQNKNDQSKSTLETIYDFLILHYIIPLTITLTFLMSYCGTLAYVGQQRVVPQLYICATMWHENKQEMFQLLKSLLRLDRHCAISRAAEGIGLVKTEDPDLFDTEIHVVFDDAFEIDNERNQEIPNMYVNQFIECLDEAATSVLGSDIKSEWNNRPVSCIMPYGGRLTWTLPGKTKMVIHMKNKNKIRRGKRWSQILYLYYLLGFKSFEYKDESSVLINRNHNKNGERRQKSSYINYLSDNDKTKFQNTFILTLDGDVDFKPSSVIRLLDRMKKNNQVGAVCGRIHPIGSGPVVWYQKFEYAIGHWLQKASEHVLGCVLCCPGCFSLFRASALADNNVMKTYTKKPTKALHYIQFEQGEDRWLCTLLLQQGYKVDYCAGADAKTFAPESFNDFFIQRRRWAPSTLANIFDLLLSWRYTVNQNADISRLFFAYQAMIMAICLLAPATVTLMVYGSFMVVLRLNAMSAFIMSIAPVAFYIFACMKLSGSFQLICAAVLSAVYSVLMMVVTVGTIISVSWGSFPSPSAWFLGFVILMFIVTALWHPREIGCLFHGGLYYITVPSTFVFLTIYYMCNLHIVKWGTRDTKPASQDKQKENGSNITLMTSIVERARRKVLDSLNVEQSSENKTAQHVGEENDALNKESRNNQIQSDTFSGLTNFDWTCLDTFFHFEKDNETPRFEEKFWNDVLTKYLKPVDRDPQSEQRIKEELINLRNKVVLGLFMLNFLFLVALLQLQMNQHLLTSFYILGKYEPVSMIFLGLFTFVLGLQFFSMLVHRWSTFQHLISSTSIVTCSGVNETEKFKINYETVKQTVVCSRSPEYMVPNYDDRNDMNSGADNHNGFGGGFDTSNKLTGRGGSYRRTSNVYATIVQRNFGRTLERECSREIPGAWRLPVPSYGRSKHKYMSTLRRKYHQGGDDLV